MGAENPAGQRSFLTLMEPYFESNEEQAALAMARARLKELPEDIHARMVICRALLVQGNIAEALGVLAQIEDALAGLSQLYEGMGDLHRHQGLEKEAEIFYQKSRALRTNPFLSRDAKESPDVAGPNAEPQEDTTDEIPPVFETVTLAELYIRQGHDRMAEELLAKILRRDAGNDRAAALLKDVRERIAQGRQNLTEEKIIQELSTWLNNIRRLRRNVF